MKHEGVEIPPKKEVTPPKINIEPENDGLEDDFPDFQGCILRFHVNLPGCYNH